MSRMLREITLYSQRRPLVSGCSTRQERDMEARMVGTILLTVSHIKLVKRGVNARRRGTKQQLLESHVSTETPTNDTRPKPEPSDLVWGATGIAEVLNVNRRQAFFLLENKRIPARKIGGRWCASRARLLEHCGA